LRYSHVFNQWFRGRRSYQHILQLLVAIAGIFIFRELAVPLVFCIFAFGAPLRAGWTAIANRKALGPQDPAPTAQPEEIDRDAGS